jgi:hypothetical protein
LTQLFAPKGHNKSAQGNALGGRTNSDPQALKGNAVKHFFSGNSGFSRFGKCGKCQLPWNPQLKRSVRKEAGYVSQEAVQSEAEAAAV